MNGHADAFTRAIRALLGAGVIAVLTVLALLSDDDATRTVLDIHDANDPVLPHERGPLAGRRLGYLVPRRVKTPIARGIFLPEVQEPRVKHSALRLVEM